MNKYLKSAKQLVTPFTKLSPTNYFILLVIELFLFFLLWTFNSFEFLPTPTGVAHAFFKLLTEESLLAELWASLKLAVRSMLIAIVISSIFSYLSVIPITTYISQFVTKGRFLTLVGLSFFFTMMSSSGEGLKTSLLVFSITVFFTTSFIAYIKDIKEYEYNHARTLGLNAWETLLEVVIIGRVSSLMEVIKQNFAIAWALLTMVESLSRSGGGIGVMLLNQSKYLKMDYIFAIQIMVLLLGMLLDSIITLIKAIVAPHTVFDNQNK